MTSGTGGVFFDLINNGSPSKVSWTVASSDDGWLALDRNGNGRIDNGTELFGNVTEQPVDQGEKNGFKALAVFDQRSRGGNGDGWITQRDQIYRRLLLWRDLNHNGASEANELSGLDVLGITGISLDYKETKWVDAFGNQFRFRAKVDREGRGRGKNKWAYDVYLITEQ